jgi:very-short-patch-repair endonuclease
VVVETTNSQDVIQLAGGRSGGRSTWTGCSVDRICTSPDRAARGSAKVTSLATMTEDRAAFDARLGPVFAVAVRQAGVVSRSQLYAIGITRGEVRAHVRAGRWRRVGGHAISTHCGPLPPEAQWWAAVLEGGPRAFLDGASALVASGLRNFTPATIRVSVPKGARIRRRRGDRVDLRETRRWRADDVVTTGIPRARPAVAAVRGALWAVSDRQAALLLTMVVQQGLCRVDDLAVEMLRVRRDKRRSFIHGVLIDLDGGVRSLGELDLVRGCRQRGLPSPELQVVRRTTSGSYYLDARWRKWRVVVEVDGIQHAWVQNVVADAIRHNAIATSDDLVLRLPVLGLRVCPDEFFAQIAEALAIRGWRGQPPAQSA